VPGVGAQGGDLDATLAAGLRADGLGVIINVGRAVSSALDPRTAAMALCNAINAARRKPRIAAVRPPAVAPARDLTALYTALHEIGAVKFGSFTLASGIQSPIYVDLRLLVSRPSLLAEAARAYAALLPGIACDRLCGVPYAALPIATAVALEADLPLIYPRKEAKQHGLGKELEGLWQPGERVVIIEDLITSGGSTIKTAERLRAAGLIVEDVVVLIDREQGGVANLAAAGLHAHAVFALSAMLDHLVARSLLATSAADDVRAFIAGNQTT